MYTIYSCSIMVAVMLLFTYTDAIAQSRRNDITIAAGHGRLPVPIILYYLVPNGGSGGDILENSSGSTFASGSYSITNRFSVGLSYGYLHYTNLYISNYGHSRKRTGVTLHTTTIGCKKIWSNKKYLRTYSLLDVGICFRKTSTEPDVQRIFHTQMTPIGMSVGGRLAANVELGIGYKGLISGGLSYTFRQNKKATPTLKEGTQM